MLQTYGGEEVVHDLIANELLGHLQHRAVDQKRAGQLSLRDDLSDGAENLRRAGDDRRHRFAISP